MKDQSGTNAELLEEISVLQQRIHKLEQAESEYKRIEEAYRDSEFKYRSLIEHSSDVIFCVDRNGEYKFVNQVFASTFDKAPDYFLGKTFWDIYPQEHADYRQEASSKVFATGESQSVEVAVPLPDKTLYFLAKANPMKDQAGEVVLNLTHATDITNRKLAEEALKENERRLHMIVEHVNDAFYIHDFEGNITDLNDNACRMMGYTREELLAPGGLPLIDAPINSELTQERLSRLMRDGFLVFEGQHKRKDGKVVDVNVSARIVSRDGKGIVQSFVSDITDRKRSEEEFRLSLKRLEEAQRIGKLGFLDWDLSTNEIELSEQTSLIYGLDGENKKPKIAEVMELVHPDDVNFVGKSLNDAIAGIAKHELEHRIVRPDGKEIYVQATAEVIRDPSGRPVRVLGTILDITDRKRAEEFLEESRERYRCLSDSAYEAVFISEKGKCLEQNKRAEEMFGYSTKEAVGRLGTEWIVPEDRDFVMKNMMAGYELPYEATGLRKDGSTFPALLRGSMMHFKGRAVRVTTMTDITEHKLVEQVLRESEEQLELVLKGSQLGFWDWNLETNEVKRNERSAEILGYKLQDIEFTVKRWLDFIHPDDQAMVARSIQEHIDGRTAMHKLEYRIRTKNGQYRWILDQAKVVKYNSCGLPSRMSGTHTDITDRKQAEEEKKNLEERLKNSEKMEMMGKLAGRVAHDLNNVLGVLSGYSELLTERIPVGNPLRVYSANIFKSSGRAAAIVEDLLTLTRRGVRVMEVAKFNKIIADLFATPEFDKLLAYYPNVIVKTDLAKDLLNISGSPVHIEKTVMNLVSNALEAVVGGGEVIIKTENRYIDRAIEGYETVKEGEYVLLTVSDTGRGIPASEVKNIFEPFYTKKSMGRSGTGLGLAIVWGAVQDHNGYIDVQSIEGKGTAFTLYFPATREKAEEETQKIPMQQYIGHGELVLVVDDVQEQREVAITLLTQLGYSVNAVSSGEDAVEYLKSNKADILVLDMIMEPGIDGFETYQQILAINPHQKAIIVSGFSETDRSKEAQKLGAGPYVKKPYLKEKIGVAIRDELARK